jgi:hypothetical protein
MLLAMLLAMLVAMLQAMWSRKPTHRNLRSIRLSSTSIPSP